MESPLEFHSQKPDNWVDGPFGFGCADYNPDQCFSTGWGSLFHDLIIRDPLSNVNENLLAIRNRVTYHRCMPRKKLPPDVLDFFRKQGAKGGKIGGAIRAERMTPEQRSESARHAIQSRWAKEKERTQDDNR
jgi:hypothetical protein